MTVNKCDRCGAIFEKKKKHYGFELVQRLYNGTRDSVNKIDLCQECEKELDKFMKKKINNETPKN